MNTLLLPAVRVIRESFSFLPRDAGHQGHQVIVAREIPLRAFSHLSVSSTIPTHPHTHAYIHTYVHGHTQKSDLSLPPPPKVGPCVRTLENGGKERKGNIRAIFPFLTRTRIGLTNRSPNRDDPTTTRIKDIEFVGCAMES